MCEDNGLHSPHESDRWFGSSRELLSRSLDDVRTNAAALPLLHILLYLLIQATYPSIVTLATLFSSYNEHDNLQYLQEALLDVIESVENQSNVRKDELARLNAEAGIDVDTGTSAQADGLSRSLQLLQTLIVSRNATLYSASRSCYFE